jgi:hypothetical protein
MSTSQCNGLVMEFQILFLIYVKLDYSFGTYLSISFAETVLIELANAFFSYHSAVLVVRFLGDQASVA